MSAFLTAQLWPVSVPIVFAAFGMALLRRPDALKVWLLLGTMVCLGTVGWTAGAGPGQAAALSLLMLPPLTAFASLVGQSPQRTQCAAWLLTLLLLGLSMGVLTADPAASTGHFSVLLAVVAASLFLKQRRAGTSGLWGIGALGLGALAAAGSLVAGPPASTVLLAMACATTLPLVPFHKGYVASLSALPGSLPSFLAMALPTLGFHKVLTVLPQIPPAVCDAFSALALTGILYGSLRAFAQARAAAVAGYGAVAFYSVLWWYLSSTQTVPPSAFVYLCAVGLATSGLVLAWHQLRARYGDVDFRTLSGLAHFMPRFAVAFSLLAIAAIGLPPFGVYAGMVGMLLAPSFSWSSALALVFLGWLAAAWYLFAFVQGLLFGAPQPEHRYEDLRGPEWASLALVLVLLIALGLMPSRWFGQGGTPSQRTVVMGASSWNR